MKYLLDTNICIYIIKRKPLEVFERFRTCEVGDIGVSTITVAALTAHKKANSQRRTRLL